MGTCRYTHQPKNRNLDPQRSVLAGESDLQVPVWTCTHAQPYIGLSLLL